jgi:hypothetical protein
VSRLTIVIGVVLIALGVIGYIATDMVSPTALIPAVFGLVLLVLGFYGGNDRTRKTAMHIAMGIALVGVLGTSRGLLQLPAALSGGDVERPAAVIAQGLMAILLIVYLALGIRSFVNARR